MPGPRARNFRLLPTIGSGYYAGRSMLEAATAGRTLQVNEGCLGSRLTHLKAGTEFFQKYFSAADRPFAIT